MASIYQLLTDEEVTFTAAVPTVWLMLLQHLEANNLKLPMLNDVTIGGSAVPRVMLEKFERDYDVGETYAGATNSRRSARLPASRQVWKI